MDTVTERAVEWVGFVRVQESKCVSPRTYMRVQRRPVTGIDAHTCTARWCPSRESTAK